MLRVCAELGAERAADIRRDHAYLAGFEAEQGRERIAGALRALIGHPGGQSSIVTPDGRRGACLHRSRRDPLVNDRVADDDLAPVE